MENDSNEWGVVNRNNMRQKREDILNQLSSLESILEQGSLTNDELLQKAHLAMKSDVTKNEEIAWRKRSRVQ